MVTVHTECSTPYGISYRITGKQPAAVLGTQGAQRLTASHIESLRGRETGFFPWRVLNALRHLI